jgi:hypothetical protein
VLTTYEWEVRFTLVSVHALGCVEKVKVSSVVPPKSHFPVKLDISSSKLNSEFTFPQLFVDGKNSILHDCRFWFCLRILGKTLCVGREMSEEGAMSRAQERSPNPTEMCGGAEFGGFGIACVRCPCKQPQESVRRRRCWRSRRTELLRIGHPRPASGHRHDPVRSYRSK